MVNGPKKQGSFLYAMAYMAALALCGGRLMGVRVRASPKSVEVNGRLDEWPCPYPFLIPPLPFPRHDERPTQTKDFSIVEFLRSHNL